MKAVVLFVLAGAATAAYAQPLNRPNTDLCERSFISDAVPGQFFDRRQADDFTLGSSAQVNSIRWWGGAAPFGGIFDLANVQSFRVVIYTDGGSVPNSLATPLFDQEFAKADTNPRETGFLTFGDNAVQFEHTVNLGTPLNVPGGTRLWMTIGSRNVDPNGPGWRWSSSLQGNFVAAQQLPFDGPWTVFDPSGANYTMVFNPPADGAVCLPDGSCMIGTEQTAFTAGGIFRGPGTSCGTAACEPFAVFSQAPTQPCNPSFNSDAIPGQFAGALSADSFTLSADSTIDSVRWWGGSQFFLDFDLFNFASWTVTVYGSDSAGAPDQNNILLEETFLQSETNPVLTPYRNRQNADLYEQTVDLPQALELSGGQRYWISIGTTNFDPNADGWRWAASLDGDGVSASKDWSTGAFTVFEPAGIEYAFQLLGTSDGTPGPCSPADLAEPFGVLNFFDLAAYLALFNAGDPAADLNNDGLLNFFDVSMYLTIFNQGCP
ncbi:MAG: hypothetical protein LAT64_08545 [Phycisphaerales bacterium]|nr:hypothetical protein [Planctomycetota bacterium]MCH8508799.1 hypothetical protein [Phycisphaerales bacterium]